MKNGTIKFAKFPRLLLEQLRCFPKGKYDDGLDAPEMAVQVAEEKTKTITMTIVGGDRKDWYGDYHINFGWPKYSKAIDLLTESFLIIKIDRAVMSMELHMQNDIIIDRSI